MVITIRGRATALRPLKKVLLVEDDPLVVASLSSLLSLNQVEAKSVHRAMNALAAVDSFHPDVAIVDIGLPDMDGRELCRTIVETFSLPVVLTSGRFAEVGRMEGTKRVRFLEKPFGMADLKAALAPLGFEIREKRRRKKRRAAAVSHA